MNSLNTPIKTKIVKMCKEDTTRFYLQGTRFKYKHSDSLKLNV